MTGPDSQSTENKTFEEEGRALIGVRVRYTCYFTISLFLIYNLLDRVIFPQLSTTLLYLRIFLALLHFILYLATFSRFGKKHPVMIGILTYTSIGWVIVAMCLLTGGHESSYYAGLLLVTIGFGIMMPWRLKDAVLTSLLINGMYMGSIILFDDITNLPLFVNNNFFLWGTSVISVVSSKIWEGYRHREFNDKQMLKELDKAKSAFFANVSHEFKTPMTLVVTPLENAAQRIPKTAPEIILPRQVFDGVRQNAYRLSGLISDLLDLTKSEIGKARLRAVEIPDTKDHLEKIFRSVVPLIEAKGIAAAFEAPARLAPHFFDTAKIDKVIINLLSNAVKFTPSGGKITMRVWDDVGGEGTLKIQVEDTGIGIASENLSRVFERFMQVDASSTRAYGGMGIGLSLVKDFVEQHGGRIEVASQVGQGSRFTVSLPRGREHFKGVLVAPQEEEIGTGIDLPQLPIAERAEKQEEHWDEEATLGETILVVDDNAEMRQAVRDVLKGKYRVIPARDGVEGVTLAREKKPDLVISDIMMPRKDGYGLLQDLKGDPATREIPVILLTAKAGEENLALGFQFGADDYIAKPFQPKEVVSRVQNLIRLRRQKEEIARQRDELGLLNQTLKETEAELVQSEKLSTVGLLAAGVAHEINNPAYAVTLNLANIESIVEEMNGNLTSETLGRLQRHLKRSQDEIERIKRITKTLLGYSQKNREGITSRNLSQDVENTLLLLKTTIEDGGTEIHWDPKSFSHSLEADHAAINQVFTNLIQNSVQAGAKNLWLEATCDDSVYRIRIADDGSGIPSEALPRVFEPFFTTKEVGSGVGLGLNIVHRIVKAHQGEIRVESTIGKGTEFRLTLPISPLHNEKT